jgi:hypothetical protein
MKLKCVKAPPNWDEFLTNGKIYTGEIIVETKVQTSNDRVDSRTDISFHCYCNKGYWTSYSLSMFVPVD